jgi:hypothetical protein
MPNLGQSFMTSFGSLAAFLLALSGAVFVLYVLTILALIGWQKVRGR